MKGLSLVFILFFGSLKLLSQDTILVSTKNTSYIVFPEGISYFDIGLPEHFVADLGQGMENETAIKDKFDNKMLKLKCISQTTDISSLMVKFGDKYEMIYLKFSLMPKKSFYKLYDDLNKSSANNNPLAVKPIAKKVVSSTVSNSSDSPLTVLSVSVTPEEIGIRCDSILKIKNELKEFGFIDPYLQAAITVIRNDKDYTYLKIAIKNSSSLPYKFDFISFQYVQKMNKGLFKSKRKSPQDVFPVRSPANSEIASNSARYVSYAIPSFGLANNGYLLVLFREKSGDRVLEIYIPSNTIQGSQGFK